jgi:hypothetical protein
MYKINNKSENETQKTTISISKKNYCILKKMGFTGEFFNDVLNRIFENNNDSLESASRVGAHDKQTNK